MPTKSKPMPLDSRSVYRRLSRWFSRNGRAFPWRGETDPYRVWVSEILLIQTTTEVGLRRYQRFLKRFPTLRALAKSSLDDVLKEWEGLGYYHRARLLHRAAQIIADQQGGRFPDDYETIRALPGVGEYCASAISNLCFGARHPPLDANVTRVGARLFGISGEARASSTRRLTHRRYTDLMQFGSGATWTNALIDLGATVCVPRNPRCDICPVESFCIAHARGKVDSLGVTRATTDRRTVNVACGIIRRADKKILIAQRLETGLLPGLWEFPGGKRDGNESLAHTCRREIKEELGIGVTVGRRRMVIPHSYSHYAVRLHVFECRYQNGRPRAIGCKRFKWVRVHDLEKYAFPTANRKIITELLNE